MDMVNVESEVSVVRDAIRYQVASLVGGIIEDLDLELVRWVVEPADRIDQSTSDVHLIEQWELNRDQRPVRGRGVGSLQAGAGTVVKCHQQESVDPVDEKNAQNEVVKCQESSCEDEVH